MCDHQQELNEWSSNPRPGLLDHSHVQLQNTSKQQEAGLER